MSECRCKHEGEIAVLKVQTEKHKRVLEGNGQKGLTILVTELIVKLEEDRKDRRKLQETVENLKTVVSGFNKFQAEAEKEVEIKERNKAKDQIKKNDIRWIITTAIVIVTYILDKIFA